MMISKLFIYLFGVFVSVHYAVNPPNIKLNYSNSADSGKTNQGESLLIVPALTLDSGRENNSDAAQISVRQENINNESGITIINHGWQLSGLSDPFEWMIPMAEAIRSRAGVARILKYQKSSGYFEELPGYDSQGETILLFDWVTESDNPSYGFSEAVADALFSALLLGEQQNNFALENIHFIGHSRGCSVNSETVERLLKTGRNVDQVTNLDPHDWGATFFFPDDHDVNHDSLVIDYPADNIPNRGVISWDGVGWSDTYWQQKGFGGRAVFGTYNLQLQTIGHSQVHDWYLGTIDGISGEDEWYGDSYPTREESGFNYSRIGGLVKPSAYGTKETILFNIETDGIINGDFERGPTSNFNQYPGWSDHGGGGIGRFVNNKLVLDQGNTWREHNRFYIPNNADKIKFHLKVGTPEQGVPPSTDKLQVLIKTNKTADYELLAEEYTNTLLDKWVELDISAYGNSVGTILFNLEEGGGNGVNSIVEIDSISLGLASLIMADIKVLLEGAYTNGNMQTSLLNSYLLPLSQPYNISPWNYPGLENVSDIPVNVVDWILVELRDKSGNNIVMGRRACFLLDNGKVVDIDGASPISFLLPSDYYYIVIFHRNHLEVMSSYPVSISVP